MRTGVVFVAMAASSATVYAQSSAPSVRPGAAALKRARAAWDDADFDVAPGLYESALKAGGLTHDDVVDAYVRIGSALAVLGDKGPAYTAFRNAALLDPGFQVPPEAGIKATTIATQARRAQVRIGSLTVGVQVADQVDAEAPFGVDVTIAPMHAALVGSVHIEARDAAARSFEQASPPGAHLHFDVPARMATSEATLVVRVEARDEHDNQLSVAEKQVHVARLPVAGARPVATPAPPLAPLAPVPALHRDEEGARASAGGFWNTAWPYVLGGAALAAGGAAVWFATRSTSDVTVLGARVVVQ